MADKGLCGVWRGGAPMLLFLVVALYIRPVQPQQNLYGDPIGCSVHRVNVIECDFRFPNRARRTGFNQWGQYNTRIVTPQSGGGTPRCEILNRGQTIQDVPTLPLDERVKFIFSPGRMLEPPEMYRNQMFVLYNISCPEGHLAFFNLTSVQMEEKNCNSTRSANGPLECIDYIRITRRPFGNTESCGTETSEDNQDQLEQGQISILFRSSDRTRQLGFQASIVCFDPGLRDRPGCTRPNEEGIPEVDESAGMSNSGRRRRDLENFHNTWKKHLAYMRRRRRRQANFEIRFLEVSVEFGVDVFYRNRQLTFQFREGETQAREPIGNIVRLATFDRNGTIRNFVGEAREGSAILALSGPGPLTIVGEYAYFQLFAIDPRGILPTPEEMVAISNITMAQFALISENETTRRTEDPRCINIVEDLGIQVPGVTPDPACVEPGRKKRQSNPVTDSSMLGDAAIITAIRNQNACNPVLLTTANATVNLVRTQEPDRYRELLAMATATDPPSTTSSPI